MYIRLVLYMINIPLFEWWGMEFLKNTLKVTKIILLLNVELEVN